ncbi:30S ribosomal protein S24e [Pyrodictium occultum]|uniref:Small ribosomal subunit protein eS24 n=2 Tax=Pyrodictium occultum TaxID=2309 RepID=A0A0V8RX78_PYROC|nr:30S ribosomal protein S24e [Pyrodictium occultum]KSW12616.1 30S ribosomal protein S24e [Pyrodictium occultum]
MELLRPKDAKRLEVDLGEGYEVYVVRDWYNPLIKRRELDLVILHVGKPTPSRMKLRHAFSKALNVDVKRLYVRKVESEYGVGRSRVEIHVYDSPERALQFEPKYIIERNKLPEEEEE